MVNHAISRKTEVKRRNFMVTDAISGVKQTNKPVKPEQPAAGHIIWSQNKLRLWLCVFIIANSDYSAH